MRNIALTVMLAGALLLAGCNKKLTHVNFDKIQPGMALSDVQKMLGKGEREEGPGGVNIGATGISGNSGSRGDEVYVWSEGDAEVKITVRDGKVVDKFAKSLSGEQTTPNSK
ncbi:MAG: hypothetical protein ACREJO_02155 [Phycisphaerales bacterium]